MKASGEHSSIVPYSISLSPDSRGSMIVRSSRLKYRAFIVKSLELESVNKSDFILSVDLFLNLKCIFALDFSEIAL